jgi:phage terminase large subunit-like protein
MHRIAECVSTGNAEHDGNPVMAWCVANTEVRMDNNGKVRPVKPPKRTCRIDGLVAMVVGLYLAMFPPETAGEFHCA